MSRRLERVARRIQQELSTQLPQLKHPDIGFVTVTRVVPSPDLRQAKVYVSFLPTRQQSDPEKSLQALQHSHGFLQARLGPALKTRVTPELRFYLDDTSERAAHLEALIEEARASDPDHNQPPDAETEPPAAPEGEGASS